MRRILAIVALALVVPGCAVFDAYRAAQHSKPSAATIAQARNTVLAVQNAYGVAVIAADKWAQPTNRCGVPAAPPPPLCSTATGVIAVNKMAVSTRTALNSAEALVLKASPEQSDLELGILTAQHGWDAYKAILVEYGIKTGG